MNIFTFQSSLNENAPPAGLSTPLQALWWDAKGNWARAHTLVDELETQDAMAVHAYLHRKVGEEWNSDYWYKRAGRQHYRPILEAEALALIEAIPANLEVNSKHGSRGKTTQAARQS